MTHQSEIDSSTIGIVADDAGGAELISSYIRENQLSCLYCLSDVAHEIFSNKLGDVTCLPMSELIDQSGWILCGTSSQSNLEWQALGMARSCGKKSVSYLDHWVNYPRRFDRGGVLQLPDEIWVGDDVALGIAKNDFPALPVRLVPNSIFKEVGLKRGALISARPADGKHLNLLYLGEPIRAGALAVYGNEMHWNFSEEEALKYFLANLHVLGHPIGRVTIRPHPKETIEKYSWVLQEYCQLPIVIDNSCSLNDQLIDSDVVAGCTTMAMVLAHLAGKRVICAVPPEGTIARLPFPEIELLQDIT
jgi:hypothetical protein